MVTIFDPNNPPAPKQPRPPRPALTPAEVMREATEFTQHYIAQLCDELLARKDCQPPNRNEPSALRHLESLVGLVTDAAQARVVAESLVQNTALRACAERQRALKGWR